MVAATVVLVFFIAARETSMAMAIGVALVCAFGTTAWSSASRVLWQHGPSMLLLALALLLQQRGRMSWVGVVLACAYVVRPTNAIPLAAAGAWILLSRPRQLPAFLIGAAAVLALFVWSNLRIYSGWLPP